MKRLPNNTWTTGLALLSVATFLSLHVGAAPAKKAKLKAETKPAIKITRVPAASLGSPGPDTMATIGGEASGVNVQAYRVVVMAYADKWYVQPYAAAPYTSIRPGGKWQTDTHLGTEYVALLVKPSYKPPAITGTAPEAGGEIVARARATPK